MPQLTPSHVFMTADTVGGVWTYALDLARGFVEAGVRTTLAVLGPDASEAQRAEAAAVPCLKLLETGLPLDWLADDERAVRKAAAAVAYLARSVGADVVHLNSPALAGAARYHAPVVGACHSCLATWWAQVRGGEPPEDFRWRIALTAAGYQACDALIAPSASFADATRRCYGPLPIFAVRNGRAGDIAAGEHPRALRVISAGRLWDEGKNLALLDAAAAQAAGPVLAVGPTAGPAGERARAAHVELLGATTPPMLRRLFDHSLIFASFARYEPFGLAVLEAAQAGCALVLSDIPTFRELWSGAALFAPPDDPGAAAAALNRLLAHPAIATGLSHQARRRAARYAVSAMVEGTLGVYRWALGRPAEAAA